MKYPTDIVYHSGSWSRIHRGHNLTRDKLQSDFRNSHGLDVAPLLNFTEVYFGYVPRIKGCEKYAWPCDDEGEWHNHWYEIKPNPDPLTHFTVVSEFR